MDKTLRLCYYIYNFDKYACACVGKTRVRTEEKAVVFGAKALV